MNSKLLILTLPIYLILIGCSDKADILENENKTSQQEPQIKKVEEAKSPSALLGVSQRDGLIIIDTNKTKHFLRGIANSLKSGVKNAHDTIKRNRVDSIEDIGISIGKNKISIDINKTEKFLNRWKNSMEDAVNQMDEAIQKAEKSLPIN